MVATVCYSKVFEHLHTGTVSVSSEHWVASVVLILQRVIWLLAVILHEHCGLLKVVLHGRDSMAMVSL